MAEHPLESEHEGTSVDVTTAIKKAVAYLQDAFKDESISDIRLEEIEFDDAKELWVVTLSFLRKVADKELPSAHRQFSALAGPGYQRDYKSVRVDAGTGEFKSIKIRMAV